MAWAVPDEVDVANLAIDILDDYPIADLEEDTVVGRFMARNFWRAFDDVLYAYPWYFARARDILAADAVEPDFGWDYSYTLPSDCVRPLPLRRNGDWNDVPIPYEIEGNKLLTDQADPLYFNYISRVENPGLWTPPFVRVLAMTLAVYGAQSITGKESYSAKAEQLLAAAWERATLADTLASGTPEAQNRHNVVNIRGVGMPSATSSLVRTVES
jgi:hypothetical protein